MKTINSNVYPNVAKLELSQISDYSGVGKCSHVILSNGKVVQACSSTYGLLKNEAFFKPFEEKMTSEGITFQAVYKNVEDCQFTADYILEGELSVKTRQDVIQPKIRLINSYDGSCKTMGFLGFYRQICSNGLHALKYEVDFKLKHTEGNIALALPSLRDMLEKYQATEGVKIVRRFQVLAEMAVPASDLQDFVKGVINSTGLFKFEKSDKNPEPSLNSQFVLDVVARESASLQTVPNRWLVYNALNEWLFNDARNSKPEAVRTDIDAKLFAAVEAFN